MPLTFQPVAKPADFKCAICLEGKGENIVAHGGYHPFHTRCIREWVNQHPSCPICREEVDRIVNVLRVPSLIFGLENNRLIRFGLAVQDLWNNLMQREEKARAVFLTTLISGNLCSLASVVVGTTLNGSFQSVKNWEETSPNAQIFIMIPQVISVISAIAAFFFSNSQKALRVVEWTQCIVFPLLNMMLIHRKGVSYLGMGLGAGIGMTAALIALRKVRKQFI